MLTTILNYLSVYVLISIITFVMSARIIKASVLNKNYMKILDERKIFLLSFVPIYNFKVLYDSIMFYQKSTNKKITEIFQDKK